MSLYYDEILAGNCFGQLDMTMPSHPAETMTMDTQVVVVDDTSNDLTELFAFPIDQLFDMARQFLKGNRESTDTERDVHRCCLSFREARE